MSTIASLLSLIDPSAIKPYSEGMESVRREEFGRQRNETGLIALAELKRQQEAQQLARQYYQQHPEALLGQGGGSTIGSLMQPSPQGAGPSPYPMAPQDVPGRNAGVSPQGGGPIPPGMAQQMTPTVTPPQSTIASLGQPQGDMQALQNRYLLDLARTSPDAALKVQQQMQGQQVNQLTMQELRLTWGTKVYEAIGQIAQGITDQASLDEGRSRIAQISPEEAARLPQFYAKEAIIPFVKRAVGVKDAAELQIKTIHEQNENLKVQAQLAQAGFTGLGDDVTGIIRGLSEEQVKQFGGRTTPAAIAYATEQARQHKAVPGQSPEVTTELRAMNKDPWKAQPEDLQQAIKNIDERKLGQGKAAEVQRGETERALRGEKTVSEVMGDRTTRLFDTQTMETVHSRMPIKEYEALPTGRVKELSSRETEQIENVKNSVPIVAQLQTHIDKIYGPGGVLARMTPDERADLAAVPGRWATQYAQKYPEVTQAQRFINSNAGALARALAGEKGAMAEGDVARAKEMLPNLETTLKVWPPANIGIQSPDTRATALGSMNSIVDMINARVRGILGNEQFTHPKLHRYETAADAQQATGSPGTPPAVAPPELPIPPLTRLNPNLPPVPGQPTPAPAAQPPAAAVPAPGPPIFPRTPIREPGAPPPGTRSHAAPAPATTHPTPPTATSTPAQDEAYRQWQQQQKPPAPAPAPANARTPATKPTPGRQSQAPAGTRLAGAPKYMNLADVAEAVRQTGKSRTEVERRARELGYTVYGSKLKLPEVTMVG